MPWTTRATRSWGGSSRRCAPRRTPFAAERSKRAKQNGRKMARSLTFWFRRKHNLAPTAPRYLDARLEEIETDFWAHFYRENKVADAVEEEESDQEAIKRQGEGGGAEHHAAEDD